MAEHLSFSSFNIKNISSSDNNSSILFNSEENSAANSVTNSKSSSIDINSFKVFKSVIAIFISSYLKIISSKLLISFNMSDALGLFQKLSASEASFSSVTTFFLLSISKKPPKFLISDT